MNVKDTKFFFQNELNSIYDKNELDEITWRVLEHLSGKSKLDIVLERSIRFDKNKLQEIINELKKNIPIQYVLGYEWWGSMKLIVNEHVLIPRPETEELALLVSQYIQTLNKNNEILLIDIGTGSGCMPIFIKKNNPLVSVEAMDISNEALSVAKMNAEQQNVFIHFFQSDILKEGFINKKKYDIIVSNPPYVLPDEKRDMHVRVLENEPNVALFVTNKDPLQFYKAIATFAKSNLKKEGKIFLEINPLFADVLYQYFNESGFHCLIKEDMYQNRRFAIIQFLIM